MAETPEQKYNRIAAAVQQTILNNFPNPNRVGCPGDARVREVAARTAIVEDDDWQHITHCSECYRDFLAAKEQIRRPGRRARTLGLVGGTALLIVAAVIGGYRYLAEQRPGDGTAVISYYAATLNLRDVSEVRGVDKPAQREIPTLPRRALELNVVLPFASEAGVYQFEITNGSGSVVARGSADAAIRDGNTVFTSRVDLSREIGGTYKFAWRREPFDWTSTSVRLQ
jgi:hypothetical protein